MSEVLALLDGLNERKLLQRAVLVKHGETLVQLQPELPTLDQDEPIDAEEQKRLENELIYGAS